MKWLSDQEELSLNNCDREPIHIPDQIQTFGTVLATDGELNEVYFVGANSEEFLGATPKTLFEQLLSVHLDESLLHSVRNTLTTSGTVHQRVRVGIFDVNNTPREIFVHRNDDGLPVIEFEKYSKGPESHIAAPIDKTRQYLANAAQTKNLEQLLEFCVTALRELTGYDRVKAYRFAADGSGEVLAESLASGVPSMLGLRYPAWDVPKQARALQVVNPLRLLNNFDAEPIPLLSSGKGPEQLDLTFAHLRGISSIHVEYMKNMDVGGSMSLGLIVDEKLWGLLACHHMTPRLISSDVRIAAELFAQMISLMIKERLSLMRVEAAKDASQTRQLILAKADATKDLLNAFPSLSSHLGGLIGCDGFALLREDKLLTDGSTPSAAAIREIAEFDPKNEELVQSSDNLINSDFLLDLSAKSEVELHKTAGCVLIRASAAAPLQIMFFRDEVARTVKWAGKPEKIISEGPLGPRITPRGSFDAYLEEQSGRCEPWSDFDLASANEVQRLLAQLAQKADRHEAIRNKDLLSHQRQQDLMIAELNHRVKNILALIRSLSRQAKASSGSLESYALALEQRIAALAAAHDLAVSDSMKGVSLRNILKTELSPYLQDDSSQAILSGPLVGLRADVAPMIALVFHEVISNAAKYGSLSAQDGVVQARWKLDDSKGLAFDWRELGGPAVVEPARHGFGRSLIERAIPYEFDGQAKLNFEPSGLHFSFILPAENLVELEDESSVILSKAHHDQSKPIAGKRVLLLEDNIVLAMDMQASLQRLGASEILDASSTDDALKLVEKQEFDLAVLDMNLRGKVEFDVAVALQERKTPFVFVTGYGSQFDIPKSLEKARILTKPIDEGTLSHALKEALGQ